MRENILAKSIREGCSWEIIVFKLISCFTLSRVRGDFGDSNQNKQNVQMNLRAREESLKGNQFHTWYEQNKVS